MHLLWMRCIDPPGRNRRGTHGSVTAARRGVAMQSRIGTGTAMYGTTGGCMHTGVSGTRPALRGHAGFTRGAGTRHRGRTHGTAGTIRRISAGLCGMLGMPARLGSRGIGASLGLRRALLGLAGLHLRTLHGIGGAGLGLDA
ncbi:hypothetical protein GCM10027285_27410 [Oleiagrimonas citrea]